MLRLTFCRFASGDVSYEIFSCWPGNINHASGISLAPSCDSGRDLPRSQLRLLESLFSCVGVKGLKIFVGDPGLLPPRLPALLAGLLFGPLPGEPVRSGGCFIGSRCGTSVPGSIGVVGLKVGVVPGEADVCAGDCPFLSVVETRTLVESWGSCAELGSDAAWFGCSDPEGVELAPLLSDELLPSEKREDMRLEDLSVAIVAKAFRHCKRNWGQDVLSPLSSYETALWTL